MSLFESAIGDDPFVIYSELPSFLLFHPQYNADILHFPAIYVYFSPHTYISVFAIKSPGSQEAQAYSAKADVVN